MEIKVNKYHYVIIYVGIFFTKLITLFHPVQISLLSDHIGDLALPTYLAGLDWSVVINRSNYYGYGFKWIYFIFFKLTNNPHIIYYSIHITQFLLIALAVTLLYKFLVERFFENKHSLLSILILGLCACSVSVKTDSEGSLLFCFLFLVLLIFKAFECFTQKGRILYSIFIPFFMSYMITLHERSVAILIAFLIVFIFDWIYTRKSFLNVPVMLVSLFITYIGQNILTDNIINLLWPAKVASGNLSNTTVSISEPLWLFDGIGQFFMFWKTLLSNTLTAINKSYGFAFIMFFIVLYGTICFLFKNKKFKEFYNENRGLIIAFLICAFTVMIIITGVAHRWGRKIYYGGSRGDEYYYKGMTYARYYLAFLAPGCVLAHVIYTKVKEFIPKWYKISTISVLVMSYVYFYFRLFPVLQINRSDTYLRFGLKPLPGRFESANVIITILVILTVLSLYLIKTKITYYILLAYISILFFYSSEILDIERPRLYSNYDRVIATIHQIDDMYGLEKDSVHYYKYVSYSYLNEHGLQFMLPEFALQYGWPAEGESGLVVSAPHLETVKKNSPTDGSVPYIEADEYFCVYIVGDDLVKDLETLGCHINYQ